MVDVERSLLGSSAPREGGDTSHARITVTSVSGLGVSIDRGSQRALGVVLERSSSRAQQSRAPCLRRVQCLVFFGNCGGISNQS